ncbi:NO-inducible flavohemoprotein [Paraflavitalea sp. CAU 1676]|uniref:NO-inducible flavohemoprotein n=1 Tax=Paraflavitalea sp. CAU 1676 TaxID=3032598 RepID=UPI0023DB4BE2|nr:NO-inducible flavohemoprotein [Paraflavitalea sp. CAU 1676]MDF2193216.1 NO-inducible flavohemoprotein [Paraflavitalea sp. CAU 1676]
MMTNAQKELIKATVPVLRENGVLLTSHFYKRMFSHNPELKHVFNMGNQQNNKQQTALAMAVLAYAEHIEDPSVLLPVINSIGQKHTSLDIRPEHYQIVGNHLLAAIGEVLGEGATPDLLDAWEAAYAQLARIMSGHEANIYRAQTAKKGGWTGWRPFVLKRREQESKEITSFYLYPADGGPVADFTPGQYISVRLFLPEINLLQPRQYSLSAAPNGEFYRISVKKEHGSNHPDGMISNRLHDVVKEGDIIEASAPAGSFVLQPVPGKPVVFISGGVGQTPLISMLESLVKAGSPHPITWVHGCRNPEVHAFQKQVNEWVDQHEQLTQHLFYDHHAGEGTAHRGFVDLEKLSEEVLQHEAQYYICGPSPFIRKHYTYLTEKGISRAAIYFEEFGPASLQLN